MAKTAKSIATKTLGSGKTINNEHIAKINKYTLVPLTAEQVYVRSYLMAHNGIDRDNERFSEAVLDDFAATLPGKGFFIEGHPGIFGKSGPGEGRFFDAVVEEIMPDDFKNLTGYDLILPSNVHKGKMLRGDVYIPKLESNVELFSKIDAGIYAYTSIGFNAKEIKQIAEKDMIYREYISGCEALEGSLVWLGAQQGAGAIKSANKKERNNMKEFLEKLAKVMGKPVSEDNVFEEIGAVITEKDNTIKELESLAAEGREYRKALVNDVIKFGVMIDEFKADGETQKKESEFLASLSLERLKSIAEKYESRARKMFPAQFEIQTAGIDKQDQKNALVENAKERANKAKN